MLSQPSFYSNLTSSKINASPRMTLSHQLFNGASFKLEDSHDNQMTIDTIQSMAMVRKIWPVTLHSNPTKIVPTISEDTFINRRSISNGRRTTNQKSTTGGSSIRSIPLRKRKAGADTYAPHVMTGVDKLHQEGFTGGGLFIGIVDSGVDYNHPALGGGFGPGHKVVAGSDLVGDAFNGTADSVPVPDSDPMDCAGHGTHVSGIIGALPNPYNFTGVAPNATLGMWKVFGCGTQTVSDVLISAFNLAFEAGVDLISASVGGNNGWTESEF